MPPKKTAAAAATSVEGKSKVLKEETKKKRKKKDKNAPKRPLSSYMYFAKVEREKIISDQPEIRNDIATIGKMVGERWSKISASQKAPFEKKAAEDRVRYEKEKEAYQCSNNK